MRYPKRAARLIDLALLVLFSPAALGQAITGTFTIDPATAVAPASAKLTWAIANASTCTASGSWTGTKATSGTLTVTNVSSNANYTLTCSRPATLGQVTLTWKAPTQNTDGSALTDLAGYKIYRSTTLATLGDSFVQVAAGISTYIVEGLSNATYYFGVKAFNSKGIDSAMSNSASKVVSGATAAASWTQSVALAVTPAPAAPELLTVGTVVYRQMIGNLNQTTLFEIGTVALGRKCTPTYDPGPPKVLASVMGHYPLANRNDSTVKLKAGQGLPMQLYARCATPATTASQLGCNGADCVERGG